MVTVWYDAAGNRYEIDSFSTLLFLDSSRSVDCFVDNVIDFTKNELLQLYRLDKPFMEECSTCDYEDGRF